MTESQKLNDKAHATGNALLSSVPIIIGVLLLTSLLTEAIPSNAWKQLFGKQLLLDSLVGAMVGSIASGHPTASYLLGGELLSSGVSLAAVTALIVSWVTVGGVQLPAEAMLLGKRFALVRNAIGFLSAIIIGFLTVHALRSLE